MVFNKGDILLNPKPLKIQLFLLLFLCCVFLFQFHVLYFISFVLIIVGLIVYNLWPPHSDDICPPTETQGAIDKTGADGEEEEETANKTSDDLSLCNTNEPCNTAISLETEQSAMISCNRSTFQSSGDIHETVASHDLPVKQK